MVKSWDRERERDLQVLTSLLEVSFWEKTKLCLIYDKRNIFSTTFKENSSIRLKPVACLRSFVRLFVRLFLRSLVQVYFIASFYDADEFGREEERDYRALKQCSSLGARSFLFPLMVFVFKENIFISPLLWSSAAEAAVVAAEVKVDYGSWEAADC